MRQGCQVDRHAERREFGFDVVAPAAGANQPLAEPVGQTLLEAYSSGRCAQGLITDAFGPQTQNPRLFAAQSVPFATGERSERGLNRLAPALDAPLPFPARQFRGQFDALIDDPQMAIVV